MIHYQLRCEPGGHGFDGWFRSGDDFDRQAGLGLVTCPACGTTAVGKALMRPAVAGVKAPTAPAVPVPEGGGVQTTMSGPMPSQAAELYAKLQAMAREVRAQADYVGSSFAEEARRIHFGETPERRIYGEASGEEVRALAEDGIPAFALPPLPEDKH